MSEPGQKAKKRSGPWKPIVFYKPIPPKPSPVLSDSEKAQRCLEAEAAIAESRQREAEAYAMGPEPPDPARVDLLKKCKAEREAVRKKHGPKTRTNIGGLCWDNEGTGLPGQPVYTTGPMGLAWGFEE